MRPWKFICGCKGVGEITYDVENGIRYYFALCKNCGRANERTLTDTVFLRAYVNLEQVTV